MSKTKVSINVLTYNHEQYIRDAIESIRKQKVNFEYEVHFFDDASIDKTVDIIRSYKENNFFIHINSNNQGISKNFCKGLLTVGTEYIFDLAGDDYIPNEDTLQKCYDFLNKHDGYSGISGWTEIRDVFGNVVGIDKNVKEEFTLKQWLMGNRPMCSHGMIRRFWNTADIRKIERIAKATRNNEEIVAWTSFLEYGPKAILQECVYGYRYINQIGQSNYNSNHKIADIFSDNYMAITYMRKNSNLCMEGLFLKYAYRYLTQSIADRNWRAFFQMWNILNIQDKIKCMKYFIYIYFTRGEIPSKIVLEIENSMLKVRKGNE